MEKVKLPYRIKKKIPFLAVYTVLSFVMLVLAILCLFSPFINTFSSVFSDEMETAYMFIGGICTPFFAFFLCYSLLNMLSPSDGLVITEKGFYEKTMADGCVGFIPADAIVSFKLFGNKKKQFLGVKLDSEAVENIGKTKKSKSEIRNNVECGMPAIIIRSCDISVPVRDLLDAMLQLYSSPTAKDASRSEEVVALQDAQEPIIKIAEPDEVDSAEFLSIIDEDDQVSPPVFSMDDLPLSVDVEQDKPRITNVDELLSHIFDRKNTSDSN